MMTAETGTTVYVADPKLQEWTVVQPPKEETK
jgi:hypothetical protein